MAITGASGCTDDELYNMNKSVFSTVANPGRTKGFLRKAMPLRLSENTPHITEDTVGCRVEASVPIVMNPGKTVGFRQIAEEEQEEPNDVLESVLMKLTDPFSRSLLKPLKTQDSRILCFSGRKAVSCFVKSGYCRKRTEAVILLQRAYSEGFIRHLTGNVAQFWDKRIYYVLTEKAGNFFSDFQMPDRASLCENERCISPTKVLPRRDKEKKERGTEKHRSNAVSRERAVSPRFQLYMEATTRLSKDLLKQQNVFEELAMRHIFSTSTGHSEHRASRSELKSPASRSRVGRLAILSSPFLRSQRSYSPDNKTTGTLCAYSPDSKAMGTLVGEKAATPATRSGIFVSVVDRPGPGQAGKHADNMGLSHLVNNMWSNVYIPGPKDEDVLAHIGRVESLKAPPPVPVPPLQRPRNLDDLFSQFSVHVTAVCFQFPQRCTHMKAFMSLLGHFSVNSGKIKSQRLRRNAHERKNSQDGARNSRAAFKAALLSNMAKHTSLHWDSYSTVQQTLGLDISLHCCALRAVLLNDAVGLEFFAKHVDMSLPVLSNTDGDEKLEEQLFENWCMRHLSHFIEDIEDALNADEVHMLQEWKSLGKDVESMLEGTAVSTCQGTEGSKGVKSRAWVQDMMARLQAADVPLKFAQNSPFVPEFNAYSAGCLIPFSNSMSFNSQEDQLKAVCLDFRTKITDILKRLATGNLRSKFHVWCRCTAAALEKELSAWLGVDTMCKFFTLLHVALALGNGIAAAQLIAVGAPFKAVLSEPNISKVASAAMALGHLDVWLQLRAAYGNDAVSVSEADLSGLHLDTVPPTLALVAASLKRVDLSFNNLNVIPTFLASCREVDVSYNPLPCLPAHLYWDPYGIPSYLGNVKASADAWSTTKVTVLCLSPLAQSMPLLSRIFGLRSAATEIRSQELTVLSCSTVDGQVAQTINVWLVPDGPGVLDEEDLISFGPRLFLTPSSHYVIAFDPSYTDITEELLQHTVRRIKHMEIFYHVFAKVTLLELRHSAESPSLADVGASRFSNIPFFIVENKETSILAFQNWLLDTLGASHPKTIPESWAQVSQFISNCEVDFVQRKGLHMWFSACGVPSEEFEDLERFLERHGIIYGWKAGDAVGHGVLLSHRCIMQTLNLIRPFKSGVVSSIITNYFKGKDVDDNLLALSASTAVLSCGVRKFEVLSSNPDRVPLYVINLLMAHNVLHEIMVSKIYYAYLVPSLLPRTIPNISTAWNIKHVQERVRIYRLKIQLPHFSHVFLSKIFNAKQSILHMWESGTLIGDSHSAVLATINRKRGKTEVIVKERSLSLASSKLFLSVLNVVEAVLEAEAQRVSVEIVVPCPHCLSRGSAAPWEFKYDTLVSLMSQGSPFAFCEDIVRSTRCIQISHMAPDVALSYFPQINPDDIIEEKVLGKGAFGLVKKCTWKGIEVAVKEHSDDGSDDPTRMFKGVLKEATIMSSLRSKFLVRLYGVAPPLRLVMEYVPYGDLYHLLHGKDAVPIDGSLQARLILDVARGMEYLQNISPPILHRDLRSPNVFIQSLDVNAPVCAKVADFGLSLQTFEKVQEGLLCWNWLAPEVLKSESYATKSDVYSFGMIMYEVLARRVPFDEFYDDPSFYREMPTEGGGTIRVLQEQTLKTAILLDGLRPTPPESSKIHKPLVKMMVMCWAEPAARPTFSNAVFIAQCVFNASLSGNIDMKDIANAWVDKANERFKKNDFCKTAVYKEDMDVSETAIRRPTAYTITRVLTESVPPTPTKFVEMTLHESIFSENAEPKLLENVATCCINKFSMACMSYVNKKDLWIGSTYGAVVVLSLPSAKVVTTLRLSPSSRVVRISQYADSVLCITETGEVHFLDMHTLAKVHTAVLSRNIISAAQLSSNGYLWCAFPNDLCLAMWAIQHRHIAERPTYLRLSMSPQNALQVQRAQNSLDGHLSGHTPLCIDIIETQSSRTVLGCSGGPNVLLVVLNDALEVISQLPLDRESGRITALLICEEDILVGTYQGLLLWKGQRLFSMQTRVISVTQLSSKWTACFGYDGSMVLLDQSMSIVKELHFSCGKSVLVQGLFTGVGIVYGTREGKVMQVSLRKEAVESDTGQAATEKLSLKQSSQNHPMTADAWCLLEFLLARQARETPILPFLQKNAEESNSQNATMDFFSICGVEAALPLIIHLLCLSFDSLCTEKSIAELQQDMALLYEQASAGSCLDRKCLRQVGRLVHGQPQSFSQRLRDFVENYIKVLVKTALTTTDLGLSFHAETESMRRERSGFEE